MKKIIPIAVALAMSSVTLAETVKTIKRTMTEERSTSPVMNMEIGSDSEMLEEDYENNLDAEEVEEERMEEGVRDDSFIKSEEEINYNDRTRTNRERKAINTGSNASDDQ
jgi:hypothetical protein